MSPFFIFLILIIGCSANYGWLVGIDGELASRLNNISGLIDYDCSENQTHIRSQQYSSSKRQNFAFKIEADICRQQNSAWIEHYNIKIKVNYSIVHLARQENQSDYTYAYRSVANIIEGPYRNLQIVTEQGTMVLNLQNASLIKQKRKQDTIALNASSIPQQKSQKPLKKVQINSLNLTKSQSQALNKSIDQNSTNNLINKQVSVTGYKSKRHLSERVDKVFIYVILSSISLIYYWIFLQKQEQIHILSSTMDVLYPYVKFMFFFDHLNLDGGWEIFFFLLFCVLEGLILLIYYGQTYLHYKKINQNYDFFLNIVYILIGLSHFYVLQILIVGWLIIRETMMMRGQKITLAKRITVHLQNSVTLSYTLVYLYLYPTPDDWPFNNKLFVVLSLLLWGYIEIIYQMSFEEGCKKWVQGVLSSIYKRLPFVNKGGENQGGQQQKQEELNQLEGDIEPNETNAQLINNKQEGLIMQ